MEIVQARMPTRILCGSICFYFWAELRFKIEIKGERNLTKNFIATWRSQRCEKLISWHYMRSSGLYKHLLWNQNVFAVKHWVVSLLWRQSIGISISISKERRYSKMAFAGLKKQINKANQVRAHDAEN